MPDTLVIRPGMFSIEDPWRVPGSIERIPLRIATDGAAPRLPTTIAAWFDDQCLTVVFSGDDDHVTATHLEHDAPLYEEDVVEIFLSPDRLTEYFEIEVNPLGTAFDARIVSLDGDRRTMQTDLAWTCDGLFAGVRKVTPESGLMSFDTVVRVPFASLGRGIPAEGEQWRANFYRIDRHPAQGTEYSAWQPTFRTPADFHVPAAFGMLLFATH